MIEKNTYSIKKLFIVFIFFGIVLALINITTEKLFFEDNTKKVALDNAIKKSKERESILINFLNQSKDTLHSLRETNIFSKYLKDDLNKNIESELSNIFLAYSKSQPSFMQLRYIDKNGFEKIRIDRDRENLKPYIVPNNKLQNKSNRYYFYDSKSKSLEKVWFSSLDLNVENGKVEVPYRPTIRAMLPIKRNGVFHGVIMINYLMDDFLRKFVNNPLYDSILCDNKGFPLYHYKKEKSWGYYNDPKYNISQEFPYQYKNILKNDLYKTEHIVSRKLDVEVLGGLNMILQLKRSYVEKQDKQSNLHHIIIASITLLASLILTLFIVKVFSRALLNIEKLTNANDKLNKQQNIITNQAVDLEESFDELHASYDSVSELSNILELEKIKLKSILNNIPDLLWVKDIDGKYITCNKRFEDFFGASEFEIIGKTDYDFVDKELADFFRNNDKEAMNSDIPLSNFEEVPFASDGHKEYLLTTKSKIIDNDDNIIGILGIGRDLTEINNYQKQLERQKEEFETIFNSSSDGIAILNLEYKFINFNPAYLKMTGFTTEELLSKTSLELVAPEDKQKTIDMLSVVIEKGLIENFTKTCIVKDKKRIIVNEGVSLLPDKKRILLITTDITNDKHLEEQSKLASMGEMIGNIAHQWRQPLSVISTGASGMKIQKEYGLLEDTFFYETCDEIDKNAQYLSKTIDDFRDFIKGDIKFSTFKISFVIKKALELLDASLKSNYINIMLSIKDDMEINGNSNELEQALINILNNAKDALVENIEEDKRVLFISTKSLNNTSLELEIYDNAGGIPNELLNKVFEPYFTTKHKSQGTGLGLSMVHKIITQRHNQKIFTYNKEFRYKEKNYKGACFTIIFDKTNQIPLSN